MSDKAKLFWLCVIVFALTQVANVADLVRADTTSPTPTPVVVTTTPVEVRDNCQMTRCRMWVSDTGQLAVEFHTPDGKAAWTTYGPGFGKENGK